jgi:hypothetical protein
MNHAHRFHFDAPPTIENVFFDDQSRGKNLFRLTFGQTATVKPVKPATADSLQRSRDRMRQLHGRVQTIEVKDEAAIALPQADTRAAMARARLQQIAQRNAAERAAPVVVLFRAQPNQPPCVNKRARLAHASQRGHNSAVESSLRQALCRSDAPQQSLFDRLLHLNTPDSALALVH